MEITVKIPQDRLDYFVKQFEDKLNRKPASHEIEDSFNCVAYNAMYEISNQDIDQIIEDDFYMA